MVRIVRRALYGLAAFLGVTFAGVVLAQAAPATPISISPTGVSAGSLMTAVTYRAPAGVGAANMGYFTRPVPISPATLGGLARGIMSRSAPALGVAAAVAAAGWAFNALRQEFEIPGQPGTPLGPMSWRLQTGPTDFIYANTPHAFIGSTVNRNLTVVSVRPIDESSFWIADLSNTGSATIIRVSTPAGAKPADERPPTPVPLADVGQLMLQNPQTWQPLLTNSDGSPVRTPEVMNEAAALGSLIAQGANTGQLGQQGWDQGNQGGEPRPQDPNANQTPIEIEFPVFCSWASKVCEFIDWFRLDDVSSDSPQVPEEQADALTVPWSSSLGGGSCPSSPVITLTEDWEVSFPVDMLCDFAAMLRPVVILLASILAMFILVGGSRAP